MASPSSAPRRSRQSTDAMADYRIEEKAGKGSFATVYKGRHRVSFLVLPFPVFSAKAPSPSPPPGPMHPFGDALRWGTEVPGDLGYGLCLDDVYCEQIKLT